MIIQLALTAPMLLASPSLEDLQQHARVIVVTLDGARVQDALDEPGAFAPAKQRPVLGKLFERIKQQGATWHGTTSSRVPLSLPGYQALFAGEQTACEGNDCARIDRETFPESIAERLRLPREQVVLVASWSRLARAMTSHDDVAVVDVGPEGPPTRGGPPWPNARWDSATIDRALELWRAHKPRLMYVGLLDMDERAHEGDQAGTVRAMQQADEALGKILDAIDALPPEEKRVTTLIVTEDHGRGPGALWTEHGKYVPLSEQIFFVATGDVVHARGAQKRGITQSELRGTVERLFGLCTKAPTVDEIVGTLPCR